jgi:hypothetical protein
MELKMTLCSKMKKIKRVIVKMVVVVVIVMMKSKVRMGTLNNNLSFQKML